MYPDRKGLPVVAQLKARSELARAAKPAAASAISAHRRPRTTSGSAKQAIPAPVANAHTGRQRKPAPTAAPHRRGQRASRVSSQRTKARSASDTKKSVGGWFMKLAPMNRKKGERRKSTAVTPATASPYIRRAKATATTIVPSEKRIGTIHGAPTHRPSAKRAEWPGGYCAYHPRSSTIRCCVVKNSGSAGGGALTIPAAKIRAWKSCTISSTTTGRQRKTTTEIVTSATPAATRTSGSAAGRNQAAI